MTLVELLVALAVTGIVLAAIFGVVQGQQTAYYEGHLQRAAQGSARAALTFLEQRVQLAGYGMDAPLAFDFDRYCPVAGSCPRDKVDDSDELVFHARNPRYWVPEVSTDEPRGNAWRILQLSGDTITVNARAGDSFPRGRILQAVCRGAARYAYMTVGQNATVAADGAVTIPLLASVESDPFRRQDSAQQTVDPCFVSGEARLFLIDRYRFHVRPPGANGAQPYLVLDPGLAGGDGPEEIVIAEGIESFQVGYVMANPALAPRGTTPGVPIAFAPGALGVTGGDGMTTLQFPGLVDPALSPYRPSSWYGYALGPPPADQRMTDHQANIRAVRIAIVARGPEPEPGPPRVEPFAPILNQDARPAWIRPDVPFNRARLETTILVRNTTARGMTDF
jgi:type IV pilus assembly protein PilW